MEVAQAADLRALIQRVIESRHFRRASKLSAFLRFICEATLEGRADDLKEQRIGTDVFGRKPGYNVSDDNIVRVQARSLRNRLASYFAEEGAAEPILIEVPRGAYAARFVERPAAVVVPDPTPTKEPETRRAEDHLLRWAPAAIGIGALLVVVAWTPSRPAAVAQPLESDVYESLLSWPDDRDTLIVLSNPRVLIYRGDPDPPPDGRGMAVSQDLHDALRPSLNNTEEDHPYHFLEAAPTAYTGMGEAVCAVHLSRIFSHLGVTTQLMQGRFLSWQSARRENLVVLGSPHINDWTLQNIPPAAYRIVRGGIRDSTNAEFYAVSRDEVGDVVVDHALITLLQLGDSKVLTLAGRSSVGTHGAGEFFASSERMQEAAEMLSGRWSAVPEQWQVLIRVEAHDGLPVSTQLLDAIAIP